MTNYQTSIQVPGAIRWGSAKIEIYDDDNTNWVNLGAVKTVAATTTTNGAQKYKPDNTAPMNIDPTPETWDWSWQMEEAWNVSTLKLLRGNIDTWTAGTGKTTVGVYAGTGKRPSRKIRITNTTAGAQPVVITLLAAKLTSDFDWNFPTDEDGTTALSLQVKVSAEISGVQGFGTVEIPTAAGSVTISPAAVSVAVGSTQSMTVTGGTTKTYGTADVAVATVSSAGVVTGVAVGTTQLIITVDNVPHYVPITVTASE